ncbi:MAG: hypothetical protein M1835_007913 [Candelina submexicana]|nr:MAG: hypothetical protein M1835_007913 [Candelina submexicana]
MQTRSQRRAVRKAREELIKSKPYSEPKALPVELIKLDSLPVQATNSSDGPTSFLDPENDRFLDYPEKNKKRRYWFARRSSIRPKRRSTREQRALSQKRPSHPCCPHTYHEAYCGEFRQRLSPERVAATLSFHKHEPCPVHTSKVDVAGNWQCCLCKKGRNHDWSSVCGTCGHERGGEGCECPVTSFNEVCDFVGMTSLASQPQLQKSKIPGTEGGASASTSCLNSSPNESHIRPSEGSPSETQSSEPESSTHYGDSYDDFVKENEPRPSQKATGGMERSGESFVTSSPAVSFRRFSWESDSEVLNSHDAAGGTETMAEPYVAYRKNSWKVGSQPHPSQEAAGPTEVNAAQYVPYSLQVRSRRFSWEDESGPPSPQEAMGSTKESIVQYVPYSPQVRSRRFSWEDESEPASPQEAMGSTTEHIIQYVPYSPQVRSRRFSWEIESEPLPPKEARPIKEVSTVQYVPYGLRVGRRFSWESESGPLPSQEAVGSLETGANQHVPYMNFSEEAESEAYSSQEAAGGTEVRVSPYVAYSPHVGSRRFSWEAE